MKTVKKRPVKTLYSPASQPASGRMRLAKYMAVCGVASRRESEEIVALGRVTVNGHIVTDPATAVDGAIDDVRFDERKLAPPKLVYWWLNKPKGVVCTNNDPAGRPTAVAMLPDKLKERVFPVGRLDEDSTGLLLLTNDGELALRLTHPRYGVPKTYLALVAGRVSRDTLDQVKKGVWLSDGRAKPTSVTVIGTQGQATRLKIVLCEGHNREIRRLFAKVGHKVIGLQRIAVGPIQIRRLPLGRARLATHDEIEMLRQFSKRQARPKGTVAVAAAPEPRRPAPRPVARPAVGRERRPATAGRRPRRPR